MTEFSFIVEQKHLDIRDHAATHYKGSSLFRGACELPEYHQCEVDPNQKLFPPSGKNGFRAADTIHSIIGACDYKIDSKDGIYISECTQKHIDNGTIKALVVWSWSTVPTDSLQVGDKLSYTIKGWIDVKDILKINSDRRFKYTKLNVL